VVDVLIIDERAGLANQRVDHVAKVNGFFAVAELPRQLLEAFVPAPEFKMVLVNPNLQFQANVLATHRVRVTLHANDAIGLYRHAKGSGGAATLCGQRTERRDFFGEAFIPLRVATSKESLHERQVVIHAHKVATAAKSQCLIECVLEVTVR
jgi:hypothetical protein